MNLQAADCVINFELPWNPARLNQRIGRVSRIGQKSNCINVINFVAKNSIEEKILAGIQLKLELFDAVFEGTSDEVEFTQEKKMAFINKIREMIGEEKELVPREQTESEELPESTPHYLNPIVFEGVGREEEELLDIETIQNEIALKEESELKKKKEAVLMEEVLENGINFLNGLMQMATGKPIVTSNEEKMISIDKETGEVTLKFRLPI